MSKTKRKKLKEIKQVIKEKENYSNLKNNSQKN